MMKNYSSLCRKWKLAKSRVTDMISDVVWQEKENRTLLAEIAELHLRLIPSFLDAWSSTWFVDSVLRFGCSVPHVLRSEL